MSLADVLKTHREAVLAYWDAEVRRAPAEREAPAVELRDHLPGVLDALMGALGPAVAPGAVEPGSPRLRPHFSLDAVVREYGLLRKALGAVSREAGARPSEQEVECLTAFLEERVAQAVAQHTQQCGEALARHAEFEQALIGVVGHDLRSPLTAIQLGTTLLTMDEGLSTHSLNTVVRIQTALARAFRLVKELLDFSQAWWEGGLTLNRGPGDLHALMRTVLEEVTVANPEREVRLRGSGDGAGFWDVRRLGQVVQNLVTHALKHSPRQTPVQVEARGGEDEVSLSIHSQGAPIAPELLPSLFQPTRREDTRGEAASGSGGLGLYLARAIVRAHGGTLEVTSSQAEGTCFTVRLPRSAPEP